MWHPDEGTLNALLDGEVPSAEALELERHLSDCAECRARLIEARSFRADALALIGEIDPVIEPAMPVSARGAQPAAPRPGRRRSPMTIGLAWAASILLAVSAGLWMSRDGQPLALDQRQAQDSLAPRTLALRDGDSAQIVSNEAATQIAAPEPSASASPAASAPAKRRVEAAAERASTDSTPLAPKLTEALADRARADAPAAALAPVKSLERVRLEEAVVTGQSEAGGRELESVEAVKLLGGSLRLVDGWRPIRIEIVEGRVRVHYRTGFGPAVLEEWRAGDSVATKLLAPPAAPADSVAAWVGRIR